METRKKLGIGAFIAIIAGIGMVLGPTLGVTMLGKPWSFIVGFVAGLFAGVGMALAVSGLLEIRQAKKSRS